MTAAKNVILSEAKDLLFFAPHAEPRRYCYKATALSGASTIETCTWTLFNDSITQ
jgi:hypothetical protein